MPDGSDPRRRDPDGDGHPPRDDYDVRDDYDDEFGYTDPRRKVRAPGVALMVVGWVGVVVSLGLAGLGIGIAVTEANQGPAAPGDDLVVGVVLAVCGLLSAAACVFVAVGGSRMRQCRSWGLAMTAAILAISSIVLVGLCAVFVLPFGIWALAVLVQPDVKREFERVARRRSRTADDAWDDDHD